MEWMAAAPDVCSAQAFAQRWRGSIIQAPSFMLDPRFMQQGLAKTEMALQQAASTAQGLGAFLYGDECDDGELGQGLGARGRGLRVQAEGG